MLLITQATEILTSKNMNCAIVSGNDEVRQTAYLSLGETWIQWNRTQFQSSATLTEEWVYGVVVGTAQG